MELRKINIDLKAHEIYESFKAEKNSIFLETGENFKGYSFIGINSFISLRQEGEVVYLNDKKQAGDFYDNLRAIINIYSLENTMDLPFIAGGIGYFEYSGSNARYEFYDNIIIIDNINKQLFISALGILKPEKESINLIEDKIKHGKRLIDKPVSCEFDLSKFKANFSKEKYLEAVEKVREYIEAGDVYIMNMTQEFECDFKGDGYNLYKKLRYINPAPYAAYMNFEKGSVVGSSPERFLKIAGKAVETRPIKGTRPRGKTLEEDKALKNELMNSEKDKSELLMIVDLERNDLSRVCKPNSVKVTELFKIETYPSVHHLVATVIGELKDEKDAIECIEVCFPGGSITGAPKIRAMEIIDELEGQERGLYTGCIGYIGFDGNVDLSIVIRTIVIKDGKAHFGVGGGITYESEPEFEYEETLHKAKALMRVLSSGEE